MRTDYLTRQRSTSSAKWIGRLELIQYIGTVVAVAAVPSAFLVMVVTGSAVLTVSLVSLLAIAGLVFGLCEIAKGVIEARDILRGND